MMGILEKALYYGLCIPNPGESLVRLKHAMESRDHQGGRAEGPGTDFPLTFGHTATRYLGWGYIEALDRSTQPAYI
jgi:hypothetical protein